MGQGSSGGCAVVDLDELLSIGEIGCEPGEGGDVDGGLKAGQEDGMIDCVKRCREVKEDEERRRLFVTLRRAVSVL